MSTRVAPWKRMRPIRGRRHENSSRFFNNFTSNRRVKLWQIAQFLLLGWNWLRLRVHTPFIALHLLSSHVIIHCYIKISAKSCGLHFLHLGQSGATNHRQFSSNWSAMCFVSLSYSQHYVRWGLKRESSLWFCKMSLSKLKKSFLSPLFCSRNKQLALVELWTKKNIHKRQVVRKIPSRAGRPCLECGDVANPEHVNK